MKFLSSTSSSASSTTTTTTTTSFHQNICNSKSGTHGCLAGKLRRLLCFKSLSKYHSDQIIRDRDMNSVELDKLRNFKTEEKIEFEPTANLGIVARLMGLESTPSIDSGNTHIHIIPNSNSLSQSTNSAESWKDFESKQGRLRRVIEKEDFFVLSFGNLGDNKELWKVKKSNLGFGESNPKRREKCRKKNGRRESVYLKNNKENQEPNNDDSFEKLIGKMNKVSNNNGKVIDSSIYVRSTKNCNGNSHVALQNLKQSKSRNHKQNSNGGKLKTTKKKQNWPLATKIETECETENSSPVSVLDIGEFTIKPELSTSEGDSRLTCSNSRRKLSTKLVNYEQLSPGNANNSKIDDQESKLTEDRCHRPMKSYPIYRNMWKYEDFEDIGPDLGLHIFEELLNEFVDQLAEYPQQKF